MDFINCWHKLTEEIDTSNYIAVKKLLMEPSLAWRVAIGWASLQWLRSLSSICFKVPLWDTPCARHSACTSRYFPTQKLVAGLARSSCDHIALILQSPSLGCFGPGLLFGSAKARVKADVGAASTWALSLCRVECKVRLLASPWQLAGSASLTSTSANFQLVRCCWVTWRVVFQFVLT